MLKYTITLFVLIIAVMIAVPSAQAQSAEDIMKQLQEQGMSEEDMQNMMGQLTALMPKMIDPGVYTSPEHGYSVDIPEGWTGTAMGPAIIVMKAESIEQGFAVGAEAFTVFVQPEEEINEDMRGKDITDIDIENFQNEVREALQQQANMNDVKILSVDRAKVNGHDCIHLLQKFTPADAESGFQGTMMSEMYVFNYGSSLLNIVYMSSEDKWDDYKGLIGDHLKTLAF